MWRARQRSGRRGVRRYDRLKPASKSGGVVAARPGHTVQLEWILPSPGERSASCGRSRGFGLTIKHGLAWHVPAARELRRLRLRGRGVRGRRAPGLAPADRKRHRRVLPGRGADDGGVGGDHPRVRHRRLHASSTSSTTRTRVQPLFYKITSYWGGLDGSIMFWVFLLSVFGVDRGLRQPRAAPRADPVRRRDHLRRADVLPVPDGRPQEPVRRRSSTAAPADGQRPQPAAAERLHGDPPAGALHRASSG